MSKLEYQIIDKVFGDVSPRIRKKIWDRVIDQLLNQQINTNCWIEVNSVIVNAVKRPIINEIMDGPV